MFACPPMPVLKRRGRDLGKESAACEGRWRSDGVRVLEVVLPAPPTPKWIRGCEDIFGNGICLLIGLVAH